MKVLQNIQFAPFLHLLPKTGTNSNPDRMPKAKSL